MRRIRRPVLIGMCAGSVIGVILGLVLSLPLAFVIALGGFWLVALGFIAAMIAIGPGEDDDDS